jgi:hypothetical protein
MVALILGFCLILAVVVIIDFSAESYYSKEFKSYFNSLYGVIGSGVPKSEKLGRGLTPNPPLGRDLLVIGIATNLAAGLVYGEPYAPFLISIVGWAASAFLCAFVAPTWWYFCEKLCTLSLPIYMAAVYFWYGLNHRRASD